MKKFVSLIGLFAVLVMSSTSVLAQSKVGVVDADKVILESAKGKKFLAEIQALAKQKEEGIKKVYDEAEAMGKEYQAKKASLTAEKKSEMEKKLSDYQIQVKRMQDDAKRELQIKQNQGYEKFSLLIEPIVKEIATEMNIDIVFSRAQSGIAYYSPAVDITDEVIKRVDAK